MYLPRFIAVSSPIIQLQSSFSGSGEHSDKQTVCDHAYCATSTMQCAFRHGSHSHLLAGPHRKRVIQETEIFEYIVKSSMLIPLYLVPVYIRTSLVLQPKLVILKSKMAAMPAKKSVSIDVLKRAQYSSI